MLKKTAFVFDTNFIIQNQQLDEVLDKLKDRYSIYITQVSIDERIAQNCRELRAKFDEAERCQEKFIRFATISFKKTYEEESEYYKKGIQEKYEAYFGDNIIPFAKDGATFTAILDRANRRLPPFSNAKDASDKGFKDCLLWLSLLDFFKDNGEDEVVFVTDDKSAFRNHAEELIKEFKAVTGRTIDIKPNAYYKELLKQRDEPVSEPEKEEEIPNIDALRSEVESTIDALRGVDYESFYGDPMWESTFSTSIPIDKEYAKTFFTNLRSDIKKHIFEQSVPASEILEINGRITDGKMEIPMRSIENALAIYENVLKKYSQYSDQFFEAAAKILNRNYKAPPQDLLPFDCDDTQLPF